MTLQEKKKKAALIAVAYYLEQEANDVKKPINSWKAVGQEVIMSNRALVQRRGRLLR